MSHFIPDEKIGEIRERTSIVDLVSQYLSLKKTGRNHIGLCPFHSEKTPSFTVNEEKEIFHCFGCGTGGNVFSFIMRMEGKSFPEAVEELAEKAGVELPKKGENFNDEAARKRETDKNQFLSLHKEAAALYHKFLMKSGDGEHARSYLKSRGIDNALAKAWQLGFGGKGWSALTDSLEKKEHRQAAEKSGLILPNKQGGHYDRFRERLLFPISDIRGNVIAFGGRTLTDDLPKYVNSPESDIYRKGKVLYGLDKTKEEIRSGGEAILVEGYMDLIALYRAGIRNVAATLGTALTTDQAQLLKRFCKRVIVLFDGDQAGQKAALRSVEILTSAGLSPFVLVLPDGDDPDSFVNKKGEEQLSLLLKEAPTGIDFVIEKELAKRPRLSPADKTEIIRNVAPFIKGIEDNLERALTVKKVAETTDVDERLILEALGSKPRRERKTPVKEKKRQPSQGENRERSAEESIVKLMLLDEEVLSSVCSTDLFNYFRDASLKQIGEKIIELYPAGGDIDLSSLMQSIGDEELSSLISKLAIKDEAYAECSTMTYFRDSDRHIRESHRKEEEKRVSREIKEAQSRNDQERVSVLYKEKQKILKARKGAQSISQEEMNG